MREAIYQAFHLDEALFAELGITHFGGGSVGVLETNVIRIYDREHLYYDPEDRTLLLLMRAETGLGNVGAVLRGIESPDGALRIEPLRSVSGGKFFLLPFPGGQMKFHIDYDAESGLYWMVASPKSDGFRTPGVPWYEACGDRRRLSRQRPSNHDGRRRHFQRRQPGHQL